MHYSFLIMLVEFVISHYCETMCY